MTLNKIDFLNLQETGMQTNQEENRTLIVGSLVVNDWLFIGFSFLVFDVVIVVMGLLWFVYLLFIG